MKSVHSAIVDLLRARSGRVDQFEADLDAALDAQPEGCTHSEMMVDGIRLGSRAISAAHNGTALARLMTPDGAAFTWSFNHNERRARTITQAIRAALDGDPYAEEAAREIKRLRCALGFDKDRFGSEAIAAEAAKAVFAERARQQSEEGWSTAHDDRHRMGELAQAAACYAAHPDLNPNVRAVLWPWNGTWWKPQDRRRDLVRAGALILAEIERLDRVRLRDERGE